MKEASIYPKTTVVEEKKTTAEEESRKAREVCLLPSLSAAPPETQTATWRESEKPLAFMNAHYLEQIEIRGEYKSLKPGSQKSDAASIYGAGDDKIPLHLTVSIVDILNVDPASESFTLKYRTYMLWEADIHDLGLSEYAEKALELGHYYPLNRLEVQRFIETCHLPKVTLFNVISITETDVLDIRIYGGERGKTAVMTNQSFTAVCRERFRLHHFPFDLQNLTMEFKLHDARTWNTFNLSISTVQFHKDSFNQPEWSILVPKVKKGPAKTLSSYIIIPVQRKSAFYVTNVLLMLLLLTSLGLSTFAFESEDLVGRTFIVLTLILTLVAFKFTTVTGALPKVPYSTLLDHFMSGSLWIMALMTVFTLMPQYGVDEEENDHTVNLALAMASIGMVVITFGVLGLISWYTVRSHFRDNHLIPLEQNRPWYSFRFANPRYLVDLQPTISLQESFYKHAATVEMVQNAWAAVEKKTK